MAAKNSKNKKERFVLLKKLFRRPDGAAPLGKAFIMTVMVLAACVLMTVLFCEMQRSVLAMRQEKTHVRYGVVLNDVPPWMPPQLANIIRRSITPEKIDFNDDRLCRKVLALAQENPWIKNIRDIHKVRQNSGDEKIGQIRVTVEFRKPFVRVAQNHRNYFVDAEGVVLPTQQVPQWKAVVDGYVFYYIDPENIPVDIRPMLERFTTICGAESPAPQPGQKWSGEDIQAGLRLAKLVSTRAYSRQISVIDIRNFNERVTDSEPELRMFAQIGNGRPTDIRFGRFLYPDGGDWYVTPEQRMEYLDTYVAKHGGRLAGIHDFIELRRGELSMSTNQSMLQLLRLFLRYFLIQ